MINKKIPFLTGLLALAVSAGALFGSGGLFNLSLGLENLTSAPKAGEITFNGDCEKTKIGNRKYAIQSYTSDRYPIYMIVENCDDITYTDYIFYILNSTAPSRVANFYFSSDLNGIEEFRFQSAKSVSITTYSVTTASINYDINTYKGGICDPYSITNLSKDKLTDSVVFDNSTTYVRGENQPNSTTLGNRNLTSLTIYYECAIGAEVLPEYLEVTAKTTFENGEEFEGPTMVNAHYSDGSVIDVTESELLSVDSSEYDSSKSGTYEILINFTDIVTINYSYYVTVKAPYPTNLEITAKESFKKGTDFEKPSYIYAIYSDGTKKDVTSIATVDSSEYNKDVVDTYEIFVSYTDEGVTIDDSYFVEVVEESVPYPVSLQIISCKQEFNIGDPFEAPTKVNATYSDDSVVAVEDLIDVDDSRYDSTTAGEYQIFISYEDAGVTVTTGYIVTVHQSAVNRLYRYTDATYGVFTLTLNADGLTGTYTRDYSGYFYTLNITWEVDPNDSSLYTIKLVNGDDLSNFASYTPFTNSSHSRVITLSSNDVFTIGLSNAGGSFAKTREFSRII